MRRCGTAFLSKCFIQEADSALILMSRIIVTTIFQVLNSLLTLLVTINMYVGPAASENIYGAQTNSRHLYVEGQSRFAHYLSKRTNDNRSEQFCVVWFRHDATLI